MLMLMFSIKATWQTQNFIPRTVLCIWIRAEGLNRVLGLNASSNIFWLWLGRSPREGIGYPLQYSWASLVAQTVKICPQCRKPGIDPCVRKIPWKREWQPTPVFLPGEPHGQRTLVGYSPWGHRVRHDGTTEQQQ